MAFYDSVQILGNTGHFSVYNTSLTFNHLNSLYHYIKMNQSLLMKRGDRNFILGNIKLTHDVNLASDKLSDPSILKLINTYQAETNALEENSQNTSDIQLVAFEQQKSLINALLFGIFCLPIKWKTIKLKDIKFDDDRLNDRFSSVLLKKLKDQSDLEILSLKDIPLDSQLLANVIQANTKLQSLHIRLPVPMSEDFLKSLTEALYSHPNVVELELCAIMDNVHYDYLDTLLDNNYRIKNIIFSQGQPQRQDLNERYRQLSSRLGKDAKERFLEERLSPESLYNLAHKSIIDNKPDTLDVLLGARNSSLSTTGSKKKREINKIKRFLPAVYYGHLEFMENSWKEKSLNFSITLPEHTESIGEQLVRAAFNKGNDKITKNVLDYGSNHLKRNLVFSKFLYKKIFESTKRHSWKKSILNYFQQEPTLFSPLATQLKLYLDIEVDLNALYKHLGKYLNTLERKHHQFDFIKKLTEISCLFEERKQEWEHHFFHLMEGTQLNKQLLQGVEDLKLVEKELNNLCLHLGKIILRADSANYGLLKRSTLNQPSSIIATKILIRRNNYLQSLNDNLKSENAFLNGKINTLEIENVSLTEKVNELNNNLNELNTTLVEERAERQLLATRLEQVTEKNTQDNAKMNAQLEQIMLLLPKVKKENTSVANGEPQAGSSSANREPQAGYSPKIFSP